MQAASVLPEGALLACKPQRNVAVRVEKRSGVLLLWIPLEPRWWMQAPFSWFFPFKKERGFALDALGAQMWEACCGDDTLEEIIQRFADTHYLRFHEARLSVTQYLRTLVERKLVALVLEEEPSRREATP